MADPDPATTAAAGRLGFDAYNAAMGGKSFYYGLPLMDWDDLAPEVQQAWDAAANAIEAEVRAAARKAVLDYAAEVWQPDARISLGRISLALRIAADRITGGPAVPAPDGGL